MILFNLEFIVRDFSRFDFIISDFIRFWLFSY